MEGKTSLFNIVLLFILAILTLTLALLAGYVFLKGDSSGQSSDKTHVETKVVHTDDEFATFALYGEKDEILNLKDDGKSATIPVAQVQIEIKYLKEVKGIKKVEEKVTHYQSELKALVSEYFLTLTRDDVRTKEGRKKIGEELVKEMNALLTETEEQKTDIVYDVILVKALCL